MPTTVQTTATALVHQAQGEQAPISLLLRSSVAIARRWRATFLAAAVLAVAGATSEASAQSLRLPGRAEVSADGISRTVLQTTDLPGTDQEMRLVLTVYPPGVGLPVHHHPAVGFNYILEGTAESQYLGETMMTFTTGQTFQDKANVEHTIFRNADQTKPLTYLIVYVVKKGESFLLVP